jgi:hypothetical protein
MPGSCVKEVAATIAGKPKSSWALTSLSIWVNLRSVALATPVILPFLAACLAGLGHSSLWVHVGPACLMPHEIGLVVYPSIFQQSVMGEKLMHWESPMC